MEGGRELCRRKDGEGNIRITCGEEGEREHGEGTGIGGEEIHLWKELET